MQSSKPSDKNLNSGLLRRIVLWVVTLTLVSAATIALGRRLGGAQSNNQIITPIPFEEMNGERVYNASGVVPLADSRFLFCDNNSGDALFELDLAEDGRKKGPLIRRPLQGLGPKAIDDMEAMTLAEEKGRRFIFCASSLSIKKTKSGQSLKVPPSGLLRVTVNSDDSLSAENMPGFRDWLIHNAPAITASANHIPDEGGLNIEGLAWDHERHALLFGLRTPLSGASPLVIPVRVKDLDGPWTTDNLKVLPPIRLTLDPAGGARGIRSIEYVASFHAFLVVVGRAVSGGNAPFALYEWKGGHRGKLRQLDVSFAPKMKPEGLTSGTVAGRPALLFVDDGGGYQVLWLDKTRL
ncbi:MAG TPA: hypothetical protein VFV58_03305 [Blastocatellia bacterium]|jgi:hypothetical protein|nr:hypothetical protein [Blastocatellia bacterium]